VLAIPAFDRTAGLLADILTARGEYDYAMDFEVMLMYLKRSA